MPLGGAAQNTPGSAPASPAPTHHVPSTTATSTTTTTMTTASTSPQSSTPKQVTPVPSPPQSHHSTSTAATPTTPQPSITTPQVLTPPSTHKPAPATTPTPSAAATSSTTPAASTPSSSNTQQQQQQNISPPLKPVTPISGTSSSSSAASNSSNSSNQYKSTSSYTTKQYIPTKVQQKELTSDMFKGVDFSSTLFVEDLTRRLVNEQVSSDGVHFDPLPFNVLFAETQIKLAQLETNLDRRLDNLVDECNEYSTELKQRMQAVQQSHQDAFQHFRELERGVNTIGAQAVHFGDELDSVNQQRNKAQSALSLINYLLELNDPTQSQRSDIFTNSERIHELAQLVKKLSSVSEDIKEITDLDKGKLEAESLSNTLENDLISQFERAQDRNDLDKMKQCATTLYNFNGGSRCRSTYVQKLRMFFDVASLRADESMAQNVSKRVIRKNIIMKDPRFKTFYKEIQKDVSREQNIIQAVFINQTSAMSMLIRRIFEQRVKAFIDNTLYMEKTNLAYLQTLHIAYRKTKKHLVEPLSSYGIAGIDFNELLSGIFFPLQEGYIKKELSSLRDILAGLVADDKEMSGEEGLNQEFTQTLIQQTESALKRCLLLSPDFTLGENIKSIFFLLLQGLCTEFIESKLHLAMKTIHVVDSKAQMTLNRLFMIILNINQVVGQVQTLYQLYVLPPILTNMAVQSQTSEQLYYNISTLESNICKALETSLNTMIGLIEKVLLEQKKNDYLGDDYDNNVTATCTNVIKLINSLYELCKSCLQGKNLTIYVEELGLKIQVVFLNHFKKYKIGQGPGALKLIRDLNSYKDLSKIFKSHRVEELFEVLFEISKLHFVGPENFKSVVEGGPLSRMDRNDLIAFIKQRSDFKSPWLDMI
ncbi:hypothetical protein SAMD00019534_055300 [Acytostelium subglobosum LB1]|uniref:hypothetical protein n=1 Tax=Acytostelium subglobosum LB1 TaxID=1410327 RepID=UPI0006449739|nr:hypothetical protein SAMD00019534_055300 [Acytostelium subglobosum LB1]GAM22355.1 hypothetical protein SAMD00019534_055300 [Acytostelium subglobosum LB1]|eukprot:XP_012754475.1 hypothetical protein SAMD00019534_055300 [Acytostelium subglobosum LB1]